MARSPPDGKLDASGSPLTSSFPLNSATAFPSSVGVRNSGALAVVEGVGDHGCEYMTGGVVIVLGPTGRNFGAGMSGGVAVVLDHDGTFRARCHPEASDAIELLAPGDADAIAAVLREHVARTGSPKAASLLDLWSDLLDLQHAPGPRLVKLVPREYRRALEARRLSADPSLAERLARSYAPDPALTSSRLLGPGSQRSKDMVAIHG